MHKPSITFLYATTAYFLFAVFSSHILRGDLNPIKIPISQYTAGDYGWVMGTALLSLALTVFTAIWILYQKSTQPALSVPGLILVFLFGIGALTESILPVAYSGTVNAQQLTLITMLTGPATFLCITVGALLISFSLRKQKNNELVYRQAMTLWCFVAVGFFATLLSFGVYPETGFGGIAQRFFLLAIVAWFMRLVVWEQHKTPDANLSLDQPE